LPHPPNASQRPPRPIPEKKASKSSKASAPAKKSEKSDKKDGPKKTLSAFILYGMAERQNIIDQNGGSETVKASEVMKLLGAAWKVVDADTKKKFEDESARDKERFLKQKKEFDETGKFTKTTEEVEADRVREEKAKASKDKDKRKRLAALEEKKAGKVSEKKTEDAEVEAGDAEVEAGAPSATAVEEEVEEDVEEPIKEDEVEDDAGEE